MACRRFLSVAVGVILCGSGVAKAADEALKYYAGGVSWGVGMGLHEKSSDIFAELQSPSLLKEQTTNINCYWKLGDIRVRNVPNEDDPKTFAMKSNFFTSLGITYHTFSDEVQSVKTFVQLGVLALFPKAPKKNYVSDKSSSLGGEFAYGFEMPYTKLFSGALGKRRSAIAIEAVYHSLLTKADMIPGEPDLFNGIGFRMTIRNYY